MARRTSQPADTAAFTDRLVSDREVIAVLGIGLTKWWCGVRDGIYPKPVYIGERCTRWRASEIERLIREGLSQKRAHKKLPAETAEASA